MLRIICLCCYLFIQSINVYGQTLTLGDNTELGSKIWRQVKQIHPINADIIINTYQKDDTPLVSLAQRHGSAIAKIPINVNNKGNWFTLLSLYYLDTGLAYWQDNSGVKKIADFSQSDKGHASILMHGQAFNLLFEQPSSGTLWLYLEAKHYAKPVTVTIMEQGQYHHQQFLTNAISLITISIMFTLAFMALILYFKTKQKVALFCAGYVGLHAIGWAFAAGLIAAFISLGNINSHYYGVYIFGFAIASASHFAFYLFNLHLNTSTRMSQFLQCFSYTALSFGIISLFIPFHFAFYLAHILAAIWIVLSLTLGFTMLGFNDFRAKYFLAGNIVYSLSLILFSLSHLNIFITKAPELWVLSALVIDCVCIVLSLSEWLKIKQKSYIKILEQSRIDPLTKVGNRLLLQERLSSIVEHYFVIFIDCDGIKAINDQLGHSAGDELLIYVSQLVQNETADHTSVFRTGGDEFVCLCSNATAAEIDQRSKNILLLLEEVHLKVKHRWPLSGVSYGLANSSECRNYQECLTLADERMYSLKYQRKKRNSAAFNQ